MQALMNLKQQFVLRASASPLWHRWQQLVPRERLALSLLGGFVLLALLYVLMWQPASR